MAVVVVALAPWITVLYRIMLYGEAFDQMLIWCALFLIWQTRRKVRDLYHTPTPTGKDNNHEATTHHAENQPARPAPPRQSCRGPRKRKR